MAPPANFRFRALTPVLALVIGLACNSTTRPQTQTGTGGSEETGGTTGSGGTVGSTGGQVGSTGGTSGGAPDASVTGGAPGTGGIIGGTGGATASPDAPVEKPSVTADAGPTTDATYPDSDFLPGRPDIRLCKKEWTMEQCCAFLCGCLNTICADSAKAKPGLASCMTWCPKISSSAARCHVYHCYVSISPTGGIKDHDSHCGHAANQVAGGGCPTNVSNP
jgi:hypothetical protein